MIVDVTVLDAVLIIDTVLLEAFTTYNFVPLGVIADSYGVVPTATLAISVFPGMEIAVMLPAPVVWHPCRKYPTVPVGLKVGPLTQPVAPWPVSAVKVIVDASVFVLVLITATRPSMALAAYTEEIRPE